MRLYPKEQIFIMRTEDWHYHEETNLMQDVFEFLDISKYTRKAEKFEGLS